MVLALSAFAAFATGCSEHDGACPEDEVCDSSTLAGQAHGVRDDGTVDVTVEQAWPDRRTEPPPLTAQEIAEACTVLAACYTESRPDPESARTEREMLLGVCTVPEAYMFWEERAVPTSNINERWSFEVRAILESGVDCDAVLALQTDRPEPIVCEEAGCWWSSFSDPIPDVTCDGDVATLRSNGKTYERDCARSWQACDPASPTGCTDRAPTRCTPPAGDRCDGSIRLGCDGNGRVSFHDCSRLEGGVCQDTDDGVRCVYPDAGECKPGDVSCEEGVLSLCVLGEMRQVDCAAMGWVCDRNSCVSAP